jgi:hypothetical protein
MGVCFANYGGNKIALTNICLLYFFRVIPWHLNFMCPILNLATFAWDAVYTQHF